MRAVIGGILALAMTAAAGGPSRAQEANAPGTALPQSPILTVDQDRLFMESLWGKRVAERIETASAALSVENRRIEADLSAEEKELTELRKTIPAEEFRRRADEFDARVGEIRRTQDAKARMISRIHDVERQQFFGAALPVMADVLRRYGAIVVLDNRAIFLATDAIDATDEMIAGIDAELGAGSDAEVSPEPQPDEPDSSNPADPGSGN